MKSDTLVDALFDALTLEWSDNGNISADAVRDSCLMVLADHLNKDLSEIEALISDRIVAKQ